MDVTIVTGGQRGVRLIGAAQRSAADAPSAAAAPPQLVLSLALPDGSSLVPVVRIGEYVRLGQVVAWSPDCEGTPLHASVSGQVSAIELRDAIGMSVRMPAIVIDNDGRDERDPGLIPVADYTLRSAEELLARIEAGGIVGLGGAAFPTNLKLAPTPSTPVETLVINGVECEPGIQCDDMLMRYRAESMLFGAQVMLHIVGAGRCVIAIEADKPEAITATRTAVKAAGDARLSVAIVPTYYPAGGERQLIEFLFGTQVPAGGLPRDVGVVCQNVGTAAAIATLIRTGEPLISRLVTVTGLGVAFPRTLEVRLGTPLSHLIEECGGYTPDITRLIAGGMMMGVALPHDALAVAKTTHCVIAATAADLVPRGPAMPCIRCGDCAEACPSHLLPQELYRHAVEEDDAGLVRFGITDCIECGCCDAVCPSQLPLVSVFGAARRQLQVNTVTTERRDLARQRFNAHTQRLAVEQAERQRRLKERRPAGRKDE